MAPHPFLSSYPVLSNPGQKRRNAQAHDNTFSDRDFNGDEREPDTANLMFLKSMNITINGDLFKQRFIEKLHTNKVTTQELVQYSLIVNGIAQIETSSQIGPESGTKMFLSDKDRLPLDDTEQEQKNDNTDEI